MVPFCPALAQHYIRLDSTGVSYTLDTDQASVRRSLHPASTSKASAHLPAWLFPGPGLEPTQYHYDASSGLTTATFACDAAESDVAAFYSQSFRAHGLAVSTLPAGRGGEQITGSSSNVVVTASLQPDPRSTAVNARIAYAPRRPPAHNTFEALWYDDSAGILRLRDTVTGDEYDMEQRDIVANNLNRPGGVASTGAGMPLWLPVYPGAIPSTKGRISWMLLKPTAEFLTRDSVQRVYKYYLEAVERAGARLTESGLGSTSSRKDSPVREYAASLTAFKGDDKVEIHIGDITWYFQGIGAKTPDEHTGIAIKYSVPKR